MTTAPKPVSRLRAWLYDSKLRRWLSASTGPRVGWLSMRQWGAILAVVIVALIVVRALAAFTVWVMAVVGYQLTANAARSIDNGLGLVIIGLLFLALLGMIGIALCEVASTLRWMHSSLRELWTERSAR